MEIKLILLISLLALVFSGCGDLTKGEIVELLENSCLKTNLQNITRENNTIYFNQELEVSIDTSCNKWELRESDEGKVLIKRV